MQPWHAGVVGGGRKRDHQGEVSVQLSVRVGEVHNLYRSGGGEGHDRSTRAVSSAFHVLLEKLKLIGEMEEGAPLRRTKMGKKWEGSTHRPLPCRAASRPSGVRGQPPRPPSAGSAGQRAAADRVAARLVESESDLAGEPAEGSQGPPRQDPRPPRRTQGK